MSDAVTPSPDTCPSCRAVLPPDAVICTNCGLNLKTGQKIGSQTVSSAPVRSGDPELRAKLVKLVVSLTAIAIVVFLAQKVWTKKVKESQREFDERFSLSPDDVNPMPANPNAAAVSNALQNQRRAPTEPSNALRIKDDLASPAYKQWKAGQELTTVTADMLHVQGPRLAVQPLIDGFAATAFWPLVAESLKEQSPDTPVQVTVDLMREARRSRGHQGGDYWPYYSRLQLLIRHGTADSKPIPIEHMVYEATTPDEIPIRQGLSPESTAIAAADELVVAAMKGDLGRVTAELAARLPAVAPKATKLAEEWLGGDNEAQAYAACMFLRTKPGRGREVLPVLAKIAYSGPPEQRLPALRALLAQGVSGEPAALPLLIRFWDHPDEAIRQEATAKMRRYVLTSEHTPYLLPAARQAGPVGRYWLAEKTLAVRSSEIQKVAGEVAFTFIQQASDPASKAMVGKLFGGGGQAARFRQAAFPLTNAQLMVCMTFPNQVLAGIGADTIYAHLRRSKNYEAALPAFRRILSQGVSPETYGTWCLTGRLGTERQCPCRAQFAALYCEGWRQYLASGANCSLWDVSSGHVSRACTLARQDTGLQRVLLQCALAQPFPLEFGERDLVSFPVSSAPPNAPDALLMALTWSKPRDAAQQMKKLAYMVSGLQSDDLGTALPIARIVLFLRPGSQDPALQTALDSAQERARKVVLAGLDAKELPLRKQAIWAACRSIDKDDLAPRMDGIVQTALACIAAVAPAGGEAIRKEAQQFRDLSKSHMSFGPSMKKALAQTSLPEEAKLLLLDTVGLRD